jgi:serine/threonine-protein phosphatase PGAM5
MRITPRQLMRLCAACVCLLSWAPAALQAAESNFTRTLFLIRHGTYVPDPKADPEAGPGLTPLGIAQARLAAARLAGLPIRFQSITSSTLTRAQQTAAEIRTLLPDVAGAASPLLSECTPPAANPAVATASAEQLACKQRLDAAFEKFAVPAVEADKHDVLVCHGNVIRYFVSRALGIDPRVWPSLSVANASLTLIRVRKDGSTQVIAMGDAGHIPPNLQSFGSDADPQLLSPALGVFATK